MPLHGLDNLPKDIRNLIESQLSAKDQKSLALARRFDEPIQKMVKGVKDLLPELESVRHLRDEFYRQRKDLKSQKLEALNKDSKLKKQFEGMEKAERAKLLDSLGDQFDKGQLAHLKQAITGLDKEIAVLKDTFKDAVAALASLKQMQQMLYDMD